MRSGAWWHAWPWLGVLLVVSCGGGGGGGADGGSDADRPDAADAGSERWDAEVPDASEPTGPLRVRLQGPEVAFVGERTCFEAVAEGRQAAQARFEWFWGDGARESGGARGCHAWSAAGDRLLSVVASTPGGERADASRSVAVVPRPAERPPTRSSALLLDAERGQLWAAVPDADAVARLGTGSLRLLDEVAVCGGPRSVARDGAVLAVACQEDGVVQLRSAEDGALLQSVALHPGSHPFGVAADPRGGRFFVTLQASGALVALDAREGRLLGRLEGLRDARALAVRDDGLVLVTRWRSDGRSSWLYAVDASDPSAMRLLGATELPAEEGLDSDTDNSGVLGFLDSVAFSPDGGTVLLAGLKANVVTGMFRTGTPLTSQTTARGAYAVLLAVGMAPPVVLARRSLDDMDYVGAVAFDPLGRRFYLAVMGAQRLLALDAYDWNVEGAIGEAGVAPRALAVAPDGASVYVYPELSREVRRYEVRRLSPEPAVAERAATVRSEPLDPTVLRGKRIFYTSADPRMSRTSYLSCASCHLDEQADGLTWDFTQRGEGLRNTIPLFGRAGMAHGPVHWTGNFDEIQDFEGDIRGGQGGRGFLTDAQWMEGDRSHPLGLPKAGLSEDLDALAAYVASLDRWPVSPYRRDGDADWEAAVARGRALFESAETGCADCHRPPRYTDSGFDESGQAILHDVGTATAVSGGRLGGPLPGFDTPTLRGLWASAPYLHDGRAATLTEVLTTYNPEDRHGRTSHLTAEQIEDLVTFLRSL